MLLESLVVFLAIMIFAWYWIVEPRFGQYMPEDWTHKEEE